ncbi:MAG TPA: hypothetical protein VGQ16_02855 [Vicinamibacterales bacterium]|jgi:hypothetical protein|nr:hypothetical protein [Vicinamibacterales bacterium]
MRTADHLLMQRTGVAIGLLRAAADVRDIRKHLDGQLATELRIARAIDFAHAIAPMASMIS